METYKNLKNSIKESSEKITKQDEWLQEMVCKEISTLLIENDQDKAKLNAPVVCVGSYYANELFIEYGEVNAKFDGFTRQLMDCHVPNKPKLYDVVASAILVELGKQSFVSSILSALNEEIVQYQYDDLLLGAKSENDDIVIVFRENFSTLGFYNGLHAIINDAFRDIDMEDVFLDNEDCFEIENKKLSFNINNFIK